MAHYGKSTGSKSKSGGGAFAVKGIGHGPKEGKLSPVDAVGEMSIRKVKDANAWMGDDQLKPGSAGKGNVH